MRRLLRLRVVSPVLVAFIAILVVLSPSSYLADTSAQVAGYLQTFNGTPASPLTWNPVDWDVTVLGHDATTIEPMEAAHGLNCAGPPATHHISLITDTVFICNDHLMTAMNNGYGAIYLTPNQLLDFSRGEAVLKWDMSTSRTSARDWVDIVIMPFEDNLQVNFQGIHNPKEAIHLELAGGNGVFVPTIWRNYVQERVPADTYHTWDMIFANFGLQASPTRRDTFELHVSRNHLKFSFPGYNNFTWVDTDIPPLSWSQGVVQINHRSYNPNKACDFDGSCGPNTWHWDNVSLSPAAPFTLLKANLPFVDATTAPVVTFPAPAPANSRLRFTGQGKPIEVSFDAGAHWVPAQVQGIEAPANDPAMGDAFWMPVPTGTRSVMFRGQRQGSIQWQIQGISIWAPGPQVILPTSTPVVGGPGNPVPPTNTPSPTPRSSNATATSTPTATVTPTATPTLKAGATPTQTATPPSSGGPGNKPPSGSGYVQTFDGTPASPQGWQPANWDVTVRGKDVTTIQPMDAAYSNNCSASGTHRISSIDQTVYICDNHLMTAMNNTYGAIYLTPDRMLDFSGGEAVLKWDMSTARSSARDWVDVVISPFDQNTQINFQGIHTPRDAIHLELAGGNDVFVPTVWRNFVQERVTADTFHTWDMIFKQFGLLASATRRDTFELRVSRDHLQFGMPGYGTKWVDANIAPLTWNQGVVQLIHRSTDPTKACNNDGSCGPNTWHWDNVSISPATPFTLLRGDRRFVNATSPAQVNFPAPAPAGAFLRFVGQGKPIQFSVDGGRSWTTARVQGKEAPPSDPAMADAFWTPVPQGTRSVLLRGTQLGTLNWDVQDISIWAPAQR